VHGKAGSTVRMGGHTWQLSSRAQVEEASSHQFTSGKNADLDQLFSPAVRIPTHFVRTSAASANRLIGGLAGTAVGTRNWEMLGREMVKLGSGASPAICTTGPCRMQRCPFAISIRFSFPPISLVSPPRLRPSWRPSSSWTALERGHRKSLVGTLWTFIIFRTSTSISLRFQLRGVSEGQTRGLGTNLGAPPKKVRFRTRKKLGLKRWRPLLGAAFFRI
jgi:hypothetical protein